MCKTLCHVLLVKMVIVDQLRGSRHDQIVGEAPAEVPKERVFQAGRKLWRPDDRDVARILALLSTPRLNPNNYSQHPSGEVATHIL